MRNLLIAAILVVGCGVPLKINTDLSRTSSTDGMRQRSRKRTSSSTQEAIQDPEHNGYAELPMELRLMIINALSPSTAQEWVRAYFASQDSMHALIPLEPRLHMCRSRWQTSEQRTRR